MNNVTPLFPREDRFTNRITAANSVFAPEAPMIIDALPEDYGPHVTGGERYEVDPLAMFSTRALWATAAGLIVALCIIAVLP